MAGPRISILTQAIEAEVYRLVSQRRRMTVPRLSYSFPQHAWRTLCQALHHLQAKGLVALTPLLWDCEIRAGKKSRESMGGRHERTADLV